jgi:hypothetical protein
VFFVMNYAYALPMTLLAHKLAGIVASSANIILKGAVIGFALGFDVGGPLSLAVFDEIFKGVLAGSMESARLLTVFSAAMLTPSWICMIYLFVGKKFKSWPMVVYDENLLNTGFINEVFQNVRLMAMSPMVYCVREPQTTPFALIGGTTLTGILAAAFGICNESFLTDYARKYGLLRTSTIVVTDKYDAFAGLLPPLYAGGGVKVILLSFAAALVGSLLTVLAVVIACGFLFFGSYRMDWTPKETGTDAQVIEAHERLLALGYPESELNDLSDGDLLTCLRAERVLVRECTGGGYTNYNGKSQTNDAFHMTVVAVERPFGRLFLSYHFRWDEGTHFYGTESFAVEPNCDTGSWLAEEFSGRVFYDSPDGTTYTAPYIDPGTEQASLSNWYENCFRQLYCADLSFPNSGTNRRGYIACSLHPLSDDASRLNGQFYYVHQSSRFQYPIQTAREYQDFNVDKHRRSYAPFERMQDYFVLLRNEDGVWRIRQ